MTSNQKSFPKPTIKILGFGGAGCNTINRLHALHINGIISVAANTDFQTLNATNADEKIHLGFEIAKGLGAGGNFHLGKSAAEYSYKELIHTIKDADIILITAGLGGGTGSAGAEIAARIAHSLNIPALAFVTLPFDFESQSRKHLAFESAAIIQQFTNTLITIPNERLFNVFDTSTPLMAALGYTDDILINAVNGLVRLMDPSTAMGVDLSHIIRFINNGNGTFISSGFSKEGNIITVVKNALNHPLLKSISLDQASGIILKIFGDPTIIEIQKAVAYLQEKANPQTEIIPVVAHGDADDQSVMATLLISGIGATPIEQPQMPIHQESQCDLPVQNNDRIDEKSYEPAQVKYDDEIEVPAFIRKGYQLIQNTPVDHE